MMIRNLVRRSYGYSGWESVIRPVFLAFCLTCFCGVDAEEQANQLNTEAPARDNSGGSGQKSSLLSRIRKNHRGTAVSERDSDCYLIVKSPDGRGSAFASEGRPRLRCRQGRLPLKRPPPRRFSIFSLVNPELLRYNTEIPIKTDSPA